MTDPSDREDATPLARALAVWRRSGEGFAPLYCERLVEEALAFLFADLGPHAVVLDLGSGVGHFAAAFEAAGAHTLALEVDRTLIRRTRAAAPGAEAALGRAESLPFRDASVDAVFAFSVLQYTDRERTLFEVRRVLRPGGRFVTIENLAGSPLARFRRLVRRATGEQTPARLALRGHLRWEERGVFARHLTEVATTPYDLVSTGMLLANPMYRVPANLPRDAWLRRLRAFFGGIDRAMFARWPAAGGAAWLLLVTGRREGDPQDGGA